MIDNSKPTINVKSFLSTESLNALRKLTRSPAIANKKSTVSPTFEVQRPNSSHREKAICQR